MRIDLKNMAVVAGIAIVGVLAAATLSSWYRKMLITGDKKAAENQTAVPPLT